MNQWIKQLKEKVIQWAQAAKDWFSLMWSKVSSLFTSKQKANITAIDQAATTATNDQTATAISDQARDAVTSREMVTQTACVPATFLQRLPWIATILSEDPITPMQRTNSSSDL